MSLCHVKDGLRIHFNARVFCLKHVRPHVFVQLFLIRPVEVLDAPPNGVHELLLGALGLLMPSSGVRLLKNVDGNTRLRLDVLYSQQLAAFLLHALLHGQALQLCSPAKSEQRALSYLSVGRAGGCFAFNLLPDCFGFLIVRAAIRTAHDATGVKHVAVLQDPCAVDGRSISPTDMSGTGGALLLPAVACCGIVVITVTVRNAVVFCDPENSVLTGPNLEISFTTRHCNRVLLRLFLNSDDFLLVFRDRLLRLLLPQRFDCMDTVPIVFLPIFNINLVARFEVQDRCQNHKWPLVAIATHVDAVVGLATPLGVINVRHFISEVLAVGEQFPKAVLSAKPVWEPVWEADAVFARAR
mmetsp:Transcript_52023/g.126975  ORF Transcript_52023/g.126975 Transcript_52023/m.126975 type:complete len:355 (-) Transcript_52023:736-1800(-)